MVINTIINTVKMEVGGALFEVHTDTAVRTIHFKKGNVEAKRNVVARKVAVSVL